MTTVILRTTARTVVPIVLLVSLALFLQGHNLPGGGFIGGVLTATGFALVYIAYDLDFLEEVVFERTATTIVDVGHTIVGDYRRLFTAGLAVAATSGLVPVALGYSYRAFGWPAFAAGGLPFMEQGYVVLHDVPVYHELELASALAFDFGVYCVVVGALLTILSVVGAE
ncbi:MAG: MnhB domain-containing protein [Halobacteriaceae archaeon]